MYYHYRQNNSGGGFDYEPDRGITRHVVIEAEDAAAADERARQIGLYFNGVDDGEGCDCCGDRWSTTWESAGKDFPAVYGQPAAEFEDGIKWIQGYGVFVHYLDGRVVGYWDEDKS